MPNHHGAEMETYGACRCGQLASRMNDGIAECQRCYQRRVEVLARKRISEAISKPLARKKKSAAAESR